MSILDFSNIQIVGKNKNELTKLPSPDQAVNQAKKNEIPKDRKKLLDELIEKMEEFKLDKDGNETNKKKFSKKERIQMIREFIVINYLNEPKFIDV